DFLGELVEARDVVLTLRRERNEARQAIVRETRSAEAAPEAAVDIAAAFELAVPVSGDRMEGRRAEVILDRAGEILGRQLLEVEAVGCDPVPLEITAVEADQ